MKQKDVYELFSRPARTRPCILSLYLNVDQSEPRNRNRGFETQLKELSSSLRKSIGEGPEQEGLTAALHRVAGFVSTYKPEGRGLAIFADESDGFFWHQDLAYPVSNEIRWDSEPLLQPLANALDELQGYGIVLADRTKLRLLMVELGGIEEHSHTEISRNRVRHVKSTGSDKAESSARMQRKADNQVRANLREVVRATGQFVKDNRLRRLVLAGTPEITAELRKLLPARLSLLVAGEVPLSMSATPEQIHAAAEPVILSYERKSEIEKAGEVVTISAKTDKAVVGLGPVLQAVNSGRVWELIYSAGLLTPGFECSECSALFAVQTPACIYCGSKVKAVENVVEHAVEHAIRKRAKVEVVTGEASATLTPAGGIGAFLKTRTKSVMQV
jgi:peptide subunit release factor 1 (eRF1)